MVSERRGKGKKRKWSKGEEKLSVPFDPKQKSPWWHHGHGGRGMSLLLSEGVLNKGKRISLINTTVFIIEQKWISPTRINPASALSFLRVSSLSLIANRLVIFVHYRQNFVWSYTTINYAVNWSTVENINKKNRAEYWDAPIKVFGTDYRVYTPIGSSMFQDFLKQISKSF